MISLSAMIERAARLNPKGIATSYGGREHSWQQVRERVASLGAGLGRYGLAEGDRVAILSLNNDRYYESIFAIPWAGYCVVPLNTRWALPENQYALEDSGTRILLFDDNFASQAEQLLAAVDGLDIAIHMGEGQSPDWAVSYEDLVDQNAPSPASSRASA